MRLLLPSILIAAAVLVASLSASAAEAPDANLRIAPRWNTAWVSPHITGNWIMLRYKHDWAKDKAPTGTVYIELPAGVHCVSAVEMPFKETPTADGKNLLVLTPVKLDMTDLLKGGLLYLSTTLKPGTEAKAKSWAEWEGGKSTPTEFDVKVADGRPVKQPKRIFTGAAMWPYMMANWPDFYNQYAQLGFNFFDYWHGAIFSTDKVHTDLVDTVKKARAAGISVAMSSSTTWGPEVFGDKPDQDALALFNNGVRSGPCPSYRGPGFHAWIDNLARIADSGVSFIQSDEETYGSGGFSGACVCSRCEARWKDWLKTNRPGMAYIGPKEVIDKYGTFSSVTAFDKLQEAKEGADLNEAANRNTDIEEQYRAWLNFRASLTTERFKIFKDAIVKASNKAGAKSSPSPMLAWWAGAADDYTLVVCMQDGRALSQTIDAVIPQLYFRYNMPPVLLREAIRKHAWATQGKGFWAGLDSDDDITSGRGGDFANTPGCLTAAVLETLMAGGKGYCMWAGAYMDTRQWAELSVVNGVIADHEDTFLDGKETTLFNAYAPDGKGDYFHPYSKEVFVSTRETKTEGLVLITDYRKERAPFWLERSTAYTGPMTLVDAFTGQTVAKLAANQWDFRIHLKDSSVRLLVWKK